MAVEAKKDTAKQLRKEIGLTGYILKPMAMTIKTLIKSSIHRPATVLYPWEKLQLPDIFRGRPGLVFDRCIGCGICMRICPTSCIDLVEVEDPKAQDESKKKVKRPKVNVGRCMMCGYCAEYCPTNAMIVTPEYEIAAYTRESLIYDPFKLQHEWKPGYEVHIEEALPSDLKKGVAAIRPVEETKETPLLEEKKCIGCSRCMKVCPVSAIEMKEFGVNEKGRPIKRPVLDVSKCVGCEQCIEECPKEALQMKVVL